LAHVVEHITKQETITLLKEYLSLVKNKGKIIIITPQEAGYNSDHTHNEFTDFNKVRAIYEELNISTKKLYSCPFPRVFGKIFKYNEFISVGEK